MYPDGSPKPSISNLLPSFVSIGEAHDDSKSVILFAEERAFISAAANRRRAEFATTRQCARQAFGGLGLVPVPLVPGSDRAPSWPPGVVGSITHCEGYRGVAVAWRASTSGIGIDAETHGPLPTGTETIILSESERRATQLLTKADSNLHWDRIVFSAKEAFYKAWHPITRLWLDFADVSIQFGAAGKLSIELLTATPDTWPFGRVTDGHWCVQGGIIMTAVVLPPEPASS